MGRGGVAGEDVVAGRIQADAVVAVVRGVIAVEGVVIGTSQADAALGVVIGRVVGESVVAGRPQDDATVVIRYIIAGNVVIVCSIKVYPRCSGGISHREPGDVHIVSTYIKHMVAGI